MIRRGAAVLLALLWAQGLWAQNVAVRAGEHDGFTRFVIRVPEGTDWALDQTASDATLTVNLPDIRFDTSEVFNRIPQSRVGALRQLRPGAPLRFALTCACTASAFLHDRALLVVDIKDPAKEVQPGLAVALPVVTAQRPYRFAGTKIAAAPAPVLPVTFAGRPNIQPADLPVARGLPGTARLEAVRSSERQLARELGRAAGQVLLDIAAPQNSGPAVDLPPPEPPPVQAMANLAVSKPIDRDMDQIAEVLSAGTAAACPGERDLALQDWSDGQPLTRQIARGRSALFGEFDRVDRNAALRLARAYLHFGFGAEAASVLAMIAPGPETELLSALAQIIETGRAEAANPFSDHHRCDSDAALWAVFAQPDRLDKANHAAVLRAAGRLPAPLRAYLGPRLSLIYSDAGEVQMAEAILRAVERIAEEPAPALDLARSNTVELRGDAAAADRQRLAIIHDASDVSPDALVALIDSQLGRDGTVTPDIPVLAAAYATEHRGGSLGPPLRRAEALAHALAGDFPGAFAALAVISDQDGKETRRGTADEVLRLLAARSDDATFLHFALREAATAEAGLAEDPGNALARRFLDLGFPRPAIRLLSGAANGPVSPARRLLRAEAALADGLPREAMAALLPLSGPQADALRGDALAQLRDHARAAAVLGAADNPDAVARNLWLAGALNAAAATGAPRYGDMARAAESLANPPPPADLPPLSDARRLIDSSTAMRGEIALLLSAATVGGPAD